MGKMDDILFRTSKFFETALENTQPPIKLAKLEISMIGKVNLRFSASVS